jgi:hypothetical protein
MKQEQSEASEEEKAGEVVSLEEGKWAKRHPVAEQINHGERNGDKLEEKLRERGEMRGSRFRGRFVAEGLAKKRAGQHHNATEAEQAAKHIGAGRNGGGGGKVEEARGPVL